MSVKQGYVFEFKNPQQQFFLCRQKYSKNFLFTNKNDIEILIGEDDLQNNQEISEAFLVQDKESLFLGVSYGFDKEFLQVLRMSLDNDKDLSIEDSFQISLSYVKNEISVSTLFMTKKNQSLAIFLHSKFSHSVKVVYFSPSSGEIFKMDKILLNQDLDIFNAQFFFEENRIVCVYVTQNSVLE